MPAKTKAEPTEQTVSPGWEPSMTLNEANIIEHVRNAQIFKDQDAAQDLQRFINLCTARKLDPFLGDVSITHYMKWNNLLKRKTPQITFVIGVDAVIARAREIPSYAGHTLQYLFDDYRESEWPFPAEKLVACMCKVYVDGDKVPTNHTALKSEYAQVNDKGELRATWATHLSVMLSKCAIVLAHRRAFPMAFAGFYAAEEIKKLESGELKDESLEFSPQEQQQPAAPQIEAAPPAQVAQQQPSPETPPAQGGASDFNKLKSDFENAKDQGTFDNACAAIPTANLSEEERARLFTIGKEVMTNKGFVGKNGKKMAKARPTEEVSA